MSFESFLIEKFGEHEPKEIDELVLDDLIANMGNLSEEHKKTLERYSNLIRLSMNNLGITSLTNFPSIVNLHVLEISLNCLTGEDFDKIPKLYPNLHKLKVTGNKIESIDVFKAISKTKIERIETIENPFMEKNKKAEEQLFDMLGNVRVINGHDRVGDIIESTDYERTSMKKSTKTTQRTMKISRMMKKKRRMKSQRRNQKNNILLIILIENIN